jgi:hypothetical protein
MIESKLSPAEEIRQIRESLKLTREQFAAKLGVTVRSIQNWEGGFKEPIHPGADRVPVVRQEGGRKKRQLIFTSGRPSGLRWNVQTSSPHSSTILRLAASSYPPVA